MARKLTSKDFNDLPEDMSFDDVEVTISGRYEFVMRPLTMGMIQSAGTEDQTYELIRVSLADARGEALNLGIEWEDKTICGKQYRVATLDSVKRLHLPMLGTLAGIVTKISYLPQGSADKLDFS